ncbi:unnamed protein product, partial [Coregonus sp. 'balchen']
PATAYPASPTSQQSDHVQLNTPPEDRGQDLVQPRIPPKTSVLIDSNGKYLEDRRLFPRHQTAKVWCSTTDSSIKLLYQVKLENPDNLVLHTGTNDLHTKGERVAEEVRKVAEKAYTLKDLLWQMIKNINQRITTDCSSLPNVSISRHHTLTCEHLYVHVHLDHEGVRIFAKDLKDVRQSSTIIPGQQQSPTTSLLFKEREEAILISAEPDTDITSPYQNLNPAVPEPTHLNPALPDTAQLNPTLHSTGGGYPSPCLNLTDSPHMQRQPLPSERQPDPARFSTDQSDPAHHSTAQPDMARLSTAIPDPASLSTAQPGPSQYSSTRPGPSKHSSTRLGPSQHSTTRP